MKNIETLIELQKIDSQIFKANEEIKNKPLEIAALEALFNERSAALKSAEEELKRAQLEHKSLELDLQSKEQAVDKQKSQLGQVKSNKEYSALQVEIGKMKADNSLLEEKIIELLEKMDILKQKVSAEQEKFAIEERKLKEEKNKIETSLKMLQEQSDSLRAQRKRIIDTGIKPEVLSLYERILDNRGELAIVPVKNDSCSGCCRSIRAQVVNELRLGKLLTCENCSRILYIENNE